MKKLVLLGCGGIGHYHLTHFVEYDDVKVVAFCDLIKDRAEDCAKIYGSGNVYTDYKEMYDTEKPDMVFICIPPNCHGDVEFETIKRDIHMFVEKPVSLSLDLAHEICKKAEEKNLITASGFQCRYDNINDATKDFIKNNDIITVNASRVGGVPEVDWWMKKETCGGQLIEQAIHQLDILRYTLGEIDTVYSINQKGYVDTTKYPLYDNDDLSLSIFKFASGATCSFMCACYSDNGASWDSKMTFGTKDARLDYVLCSSATIYGKDVDSAANDVDGTIKGDGTQRKNENEEGIKIDSNIDFGSLCDKTFIDAVITGDRSKIRSPYSDALRSLAVGLACNESMRTGLPVKVRY